ncbi:VPS10 domain-containing receptor [Takifugu flavidus]|uniref:VPS10 domain-containing receptor n=1 Tax=Takifugu flavidus TaxID=433684 RepID=A0A5C6PJY6_9TELE|nr:VPS10 domain-containing receptor [Takifugu flavidus]
METRPGRWLFAIFLEWIWLFSATSILAGTKAEVRCSPSCQLTLITAYPWEVSELDLTDSGEASFEDADGFVEVSQRENPRVDEKHHAVKSSSTVQPEFGADSPRAPQEDGQNDKEKLSISKVSPGNVLRTSDSTLRDSDLKENSTDVGQNRSLEMEQLPDIVTEDAAGSSKSRTRSARSAETWSGFRAEGVEDASLLDQEEFQLTSSTFALSEDTAHNQAMVHWSGQNSSVSGFAALQIYARLPLTHCGQRSLARLAVLI